MKRNVIISGPDGSGKSEMLKNMTAIFVPDSIISALIVDDRWIKDLKELKYSVAIIEGVSLNNIVKWNKELLKTKGLTVYYTTLESCKNFEHKNDFLIVNCTENNISTKINSETIISDSYLPTRDDNDLFARSVELSTRSKPKTASKIVKLNKLEPHVINGNTSTMIMAKSIGDAQKQCKQRWPNLKIESIDTLGSSETVHELKIHPTEFVLVCTQLKKAEYRSTEDRDFRVNDLMKLREWEPEAKYYTGRSATVIITHVQTGFGIPEGFAVLSNSMLTHNLNNKYSESKKMS